MSAKPIQVAAELLVFFLQFGGGQSLAIRVFGGPERSEVFALPCPQGDLGDAEFPGDLGERFAAVRKERQGILLELRVIAFSFLAVLHQRIYTNFRCP